MEGRPHASLGKYSFWLGIVAVVLAFTPISVAFLFHTSGFLDGALESTPSIVVPGLIALAALALGIVELAQKRRGKRLAVLATALSVVALAGCALTINGFIQIFGP